MSVHSISGEILDGAAPGASAELVSMLRKMLADAEAGRLVCMAGVIGYTERGKLDIRLATHTNNFEVHDRLLARIGILRTMMEQDLLGKMGALEPIQGPGDDAA